MSASMPASATHLLLIPSYNTGPQVYETVRAARAQWNPVWVVTDGSTDGTPEGLRRMAEADLGLKLIALPNNVGKGAAVLHGLIAARDSNVRVPDQVAVAGYGDLDFAAHMTPALTTIRVSDYDTGRLAGLALRTRLEGGAPADPIIQVPMQLVVRESTPAR